MKKFFRISSILLAISMLFSFAACNGNESSEGENTSTTSYVREDKTVISALNGIHGIGIAKLSCDRDYAYDVEYYGSADEIVTLLKENKTDIATLPVTVASTLYNELGGKIKVIAVNGLGALQLIANGEEIKSLDSLSGKTVYSLGKGTATENILNALFEAKGISVSISYVDTADEITALFSKGEAKLCILPEPLASGTVALNEGSKIALDLCDEWSKLFDFPLAQSVVVARTEYIEQNPSYISEFLMYNEISVNYININLNSGAPSLLAALGIFETEDLAYLAVPGCNLSFIKGADMKTAINGVLDVLYKANPAQIGGKLPDDGFFFTE